MSIERNPEKCWSRPSLIGRRLQVHDVVSGCYYDGEESYRTDFEVSQQQVLDALNYCSSLKCQENFGPNDQYCVNCQLDAIHRGDIIDAKNHSSKTNRENDILSADGKYVFVGNRDDYDEDSFGYEGWIMAQELLLRMKKPF